MEENEDNLCDLSKLIEELREVSRDKEENKDKEQVTNKKEDS